MVGPIPHRWLQLQVGQGTMFTVIRYQLGEFSPARREVASQQDVTVGDEQRTPVFASFPCHEHSCRHAAGAAQRNRRAPLQTACSPLQVSVPLLRPAVAHDVAPGTAETSGY